MPTLHLGITVHLLKKIQLRMTFIDRPIGENDSDVANLYMYRVVKNFQSRHLCGDK